jgi:hypothetical protein
MSNGSFAVAQASTSVFQILCDDFAWAKARATQIFNAPPLRAFAHP